MEPPYMMIISRSLSCEPGYMFRMVKMRYEYQSWIIENLGYEAICTHSIMMQEEKVDYFFELRSQVDATAFKLRWM